MSIQVIAAGYWYYPTPPDLSWTVGNQLLDASGEYVALVFRAPKAGSLRKHAALLGAISNLPDNGLRFSFQTVDPTTGLPDGVVDQFATIAIPTASVWNDPGNFDADRTVTKGELVAAVIDFPSFVVGDSVNVRNGLNNTLTGIPYSILNGVKVTTGLPLIAVMYSDSTWAYLDNLMALPTTTLTTATYALATAVADEYGLSFSLPGPVRCVGMAAYVALTAAGSFEFLLYEGTTVKRRATVDSDALAVNTVRLVSVLWEDDGAGTTADSYDLAANTVYTVSIRPLGTQTASIIYTTFAELGIVAGALTGGNSVYLSRRLDQGAWQHFNNGTDGYARAPISALLSGLGDDAGGGTAEHLDLGRGW